MTKDQHQPELQDPFEADLNEAAADRLRAVLVPSGLDGDLRASLLRAAGPQMAANRTGGGAGGTGWWTVRRAGPWAAAAMLVMTVSVVVLTRKPAGTSESMLAATDPMDTNHDGVVDILDAHALAMAVQAGDAAKLGMGLDANSDGVLTTADADWIAARVVQLNGTGSVGGAGGAG